MASENKLKVQFIEQLWQDSVCLVAQVPPVRCSCDDATTALILFIPMSQLNTNQTT